MDNFGTMAKNGLSILLVDDDIDDTAIFEETIRDMIIPVHFQSALDGQEALDLLSRITDYPDLIFLDLNMPLLNGKECLAQLKANPQWKSIPVIMYTTSSHSKDIEETMMGGAIAFVTKPTGLTDIQIILSTIIKSMPHNMINALRLLGNSNHSFIVC